MFKGIEVFILNFIKAAFKSIMKKKLIFIFLTLQFSLCYFITMKSYSTYKIMNSQVDLINRCMDVNKTYLLKTSNIPDAALDGSLKKFLNKVEMVNGVHGAVANYHYTSKDVSPFKQDMLSINSGTLNSFKLNIHSGRNLASEDFKDTSNYTNVPILIGSNLSQIYRLGDIIKCPPDKMDNSTFEVVGILQANQIFLKNNPISEGPLNLDNCIIMPTNCDLSEIVNSYWNNFVYIPSKSRDTIAEIMKLSGDSNITIDISPIKDLVEAQYEEELTSLRKYLMINVAMVLFSLFGIAVTMIMLVQCRRRELGIRLCAGGTKTYLYLLILLEMILMDVLGYFIGMVIYRYKEGKIIEVSLSQSFFQFYNFKVIGTMVGISIALIMIFSLDVVRRLYKVEPRQLIKGHD